MNDEKKIREQLEANIPEDAVSKRAAFTGGKKLSYLEGWYVTNRMNQIFGNGKWGQEIIELRQVGGDVQIKDRNGNDVWQVSYLARVKISSYDPLNDKATPMFESIEDVGYGNGSDKKTAGAAHELAAKEAVTDAFKRCCKSLGKSMGLALYDKSQEFVGEPAPVTSISKSGPKKAVLLETITKSSKVLMDTGKATLAELQAEMKSEYGVTKKEQLTPAQAKAFVARLTERVTAATN